MEHWFKLFYKLLQNNVFDYVFGSINDDILQNRVKYPLYLNYFDYFNKNIFEQCNNYVKTCDVNAKRFCTLISRHDHGNTRLNIFNKLSEIFQVDSPSDCAKNIDNCELETIKNVEFIKKYIFNLCPVNFKCEQKGYIVEKLLNCCLGCAIPIYFGDIDEIDAKIFNVDRIIVYDPHDSKSINDTCDYVRKMMENPEILSEFYKKPIFMDDAYITCLNMHNNVQKMFDSLLCLSNNII